MKKSVFLLLCLIGFVSMACASQDEVSLPNPEREAQQEEPGQQVEEAQPAVQAQSPALENDSIYDATECPFEPWTDIDIECGILTVSENRLRADAPTIELAVATLRASGAVVQPDPIIYLEGGPGGSALAGLSDDPDSWLEYPFHETYDIIFIDQRGTGFSLPSLNCPELDTDDADSAAACYQRLVDEGIDLAAYNTAQNAADIADLIQVMGYEQANLFGISYGTRLALAVMRDYPRTIRSVILDSPFPPQLDLPVEDTRSNLTAFETLFAACANDVDCDEAYPELETVFLETLTYLNQNPDDLDGAEIYGDDLANAIIQALYVKEYIPLLPRVIYEVSDGNYDTFLLIAEGAGSDEASRYSPPRQDDDEDISDSEGMFNAVTCRDEYAFGDYAEVETQIEAEAPPALQPFLLDSTAEMFDTCDLWDVGQADATENEAVSSDIPTLILVGQFDPVTPPAWGRLTAQTLSQSYLFELPGFGHSLSSTPGCPVMLITQFLEDPFTRPDSTCVDALPAVSFSLPDDPIDLE